MIRFCFRKININLVRGICEWSRFCRFFFFSMGPKPKTYLKSRLLAKKLGECGTGSSLCELPVTMELSAFIIKL